MSEAENKKRKKIGLALGGGGAKGLAHIGVIKTLERAGIPIDFVAGTSMGAIVGGWYAAGKEMEELEEIFLKFRWRDLFPLKEIIGRRGKGILRGQSVGELLSSHFQNRKIEDCPKPFAAVATDVKNGDAVVIKNGSLSEAVKASIALPIVFDPVAADGKILMDGGFSNPVPADVARKMGADYIIAVDVSSRWAPYEEYPDSRKSVLSIVADSLAIIEYQIAKNILKEADIVLRPPVLNFEWLAFGQAQEIIGRGAEETQIHLKEIARGSGHRCPPKTIGEKFLDFLFDV